jgi:hypothetical protein
MASEPKAGTALPHLTQIYCCSLASLRSPSIRVIATPGSMLAYNNSRIQPAYRGGGGGCRDLFTKDASFKATAAFWAIARENGVEPKL